MPHIYFKPSSARALSIAVLAAVVIVSAAPPTAAQGPSAQQTASGSSLAAAIQAKISSVTPLLSQSPPDIAALAAFYEARGFTAVWVDEGGPTRAARAVLSEFKSSANWGLDPNSYATPFAAAPLTAGRWTPDIAAAAEFEISSLVLKYAQEARGARIAEPERMLSSYLDRRPVLPVLADVFARVAAAEHPETALRAFHPQQAQFRLLQSAYTKLRQAAALDPAAMIPRDGPLLTPGMRHPDVAILRLRLNEPSAPDAKSADIYDAALVASVKRFQDRAGLADDGLVGSATRKALTGSNASKLATIRANLEQWRWMPEDLGNTHLFVNIPSFSIALMRGGVAVLQERVITGKSETQTPIFSKALTTVVLRPTWKMPDSIKLEKLLSVQRGGRSLEAQGYVIKKGKKIVDSGDVDWGHANLTAYEIYQPSGDGNALGDVKFLFPNKHSVYLHDTPMKALFNEDERLYSHGCVRLRNPLTLAQIVLDMDKGKGRYDVKDLVSDGPEVNTVSLNWPIPVHIGYFTAWADNDSTVRIFDDAYGHEKRIRLALDNKWKEIEKGDDHLAAIDTDALKSIVVDQRPRRAGTQSAGRSQRRYDPPMGLTKAAATKPSFWKPARARAERDSVGEMMRSALQNR
jgi:L,D-transpeptidase YcbB